jgi:hypothetical protein
MHLLNKATRPSAPSIRGRPQMSLPGGFLARPMIHPYHANTSRGLDMRLTEGFFELGGVQLEEGEILT